jgi:hypothetical protein
MAGIPEVLLPVGAETIQLEDVPALLANALYPDLPERPYVLKTFTKHLGQSPTSRRAFCDDKDLEAVARLAGPPPPRGEAIAREELDAYLTRFNTSPNRPDWSLGASVINRDLDDAIKRMAAEEEHRRALKAAIRSGVVVALSHARVPLNQSIREALNLGQIFVDDFRKYAQTFGIAVRIDNASSPRTRHKGMWSVAEVVQQAALAQYHHYKYEACSEDERSATLARIESNIRDDIESLRGAGAVIPRIPDTGRASAIDSPLDLRWTLTRDDLETVLRFARANAEGKRDFLLDRKRLRGLGRYTLRQAAASISANSEENFQAVLSRLVRAAEAYEFPMYAPGRFQKIVYGTGRGEAHHVREFFEEAYWDDLNAWLETHERRIAFRFHNPAGDAAGAGGDRESKTAGGSAHVTVRDFAERIAAAATDRYPEKWMHATDPDPLRRTIVAAINAHGWPFDGIPGVLPYIYGELESGEVGALSTFNDLPFSDVSEVRANPDKWYLTADAQDQLLQRIAGAGGRAVASGAQSGQHTRNRDPGVISQAKLRRDALDPAIDRAIAAAGNLDTASVWNELRELALDEEKPFNGQIQDGALVYTNGSNQVRNFNKDALRKRLKLRGKRRTAVANSR